MALPTALDNLLGSVALWIPQGSGAALFVTALLVLMVAGLGLFLRHRALERAARRQAVAERHPDMALTVEAGGAIGWINEAVATRLGHGLDMVGRPAAEVLPPGLLPLLEKSGDPPPREQKLIDRDGRGLWVLARAVQMGPGEDDPTLLLLHETTAQRNRLAEAERAVEEARREALRDPLTGLAHRAALLPRLSHGLDMARRRGRWLGVMMIGVRGLELRAQRRGSAAADLALRQLAMRLRRALEPGAFLVRQEAGRFVAVLNGIGGGKPIERQADRLLAAAPPPGLDDAGLVACAGLALADPEQSPAGPDEADRLVESAALALRHAENKGPTVVRFDPSLSEAASAEMTLAESIAAAVRGRRITALLSPQMDLDSGGISGFVVLPSVAEPVGNAPPAADFRAAAEAAGAAADCAVMALEAALAASASLCRGEEGGRRLVLPLHAPCGPDLIDRLKLVLDRVEVPVERLCVRFCDAASFDQRATIWLRHAGFRIELPASAAGMAPRLRRAFGGLFLEPLAKERGDQRAEKAAIAAFAAMAGALEADLVATDIGNRRSLSRLAELGCTHAEGPAVGKPLALEAVESFLATGRAASQPRSPRARKVQSKR